MFIVVCIFSFVAMMSLLVFAHEFGHYYAARSLNIACTHFSLGFGPALFSWVDKNGCKWQLCIIPVGGYVRFLGDSGPTSNFDAGDLERIAATIPVEERSKYFSLRSPSDRAIVTAAGPLSNFLVGLTIIAALFAFEGERVTPPVVGSIVAGEVAEAAGMKEGDRIERIDSYQIEQFENIIRYVSQRPGQEVEIVGKHADGKAFDIDAKLGSVPMKVFGVKQTVGRLGIGGGQSVVHNVSVSRAIVAASDHVIQTTVDTLMMLGRMISGDMPLSNIGGPVKIGEAAGYAAYAGIDMFFSMMSIISINIAVMNLLPIPALDGGHLVICAWEAITRRAISRPALNLIQTTGAAFLIAFMLLATILDISSIFLDNFFIDV